MSTSPMRSADATVHRRGLAAFLRSNPDFFLRNGDLLANLRLPHISGGAISLVERQIEVLREKLHASDAAAGRAGVDRARQRGARREDPPVHAAPDGRAHAARDPGADRAQLPRGLRRRADRAADVRRASGRCRPALRAQRRRSGMRTSPVSSRCWPPASPAVARCATRSANSCSAPTPARSARWRWCRCAVPRRSGCWCWAAMTASVSIPA